MKKSKISSVNDRLFAQATEDICEFEEAVKLWSDSTEQPALLVDIAVGRGRGRLALARLAERDLKEDDKYLGKLDRIFSRTEGLLRDIVNAKDSFAECFARESYPWLAVREAERWLSLVRETARDGILFDNEDWLYDELWEAGSNFLIQFGELAWLHRWPEPSFCSAPGYAEWRGAFERTEELFRRWFGYFYPLRDLLANCREREYGAAFWWLMTLPEKSMLGDPALTDAHVQALGRSLKQAGLTAEPCPEELVMALALEDPLTDVQRALVKKHISSCRECQELYDDVKNSAQEADGAKRSGRAAPLPEWLTAFLAPKGFSVNTTIPVNLNTPSEFAARLQIVPAWQLIPESSDAPPSRHQISISWPSQQALEQILPKSGLVGALQEAVCVPWGIADSGEGTRVWAKIALVKDDVLQELSLVELQDIDILPGENTTNIIVSLPSWLQLPDTATWFCDLLLSDGTLLPPQKMKSGPRSALVTFSGGLEKDAFHGGDKPTTLRVLVVVYQEEKSIFRG